MMLRWLGVGLVFLGLMGALAAWQPTESLRKLLVPDDPQDALRVFHAWLVARGLDAQKKDQVVVLRKGILVNITPLVYKGELDRLRFTCYFNPKPELKGTEALRQFAERLNRTQNFLQVYVDADGDLALGGNLTFFDELGEQHFDAFVELFSGWSSAMS